MCKKQKQSSGRARAKGSHSSFFMPAYLLGLLLVLAVFLFWQREYFFPAGDESSLSISVILDGEQNYENNIIREGMNQAAFDYNCELTFVTPLKARDSQEQAELLSKEEIDPPRALIIRPADSAAICAALDELHLRSAILLVNSDRKNDKYTQIGSDYTAIGTFMAEEIAARHENMPPVRIYHQTRRDSASLAIEKAFRERWKQLGGEIGERRGLEPREDSFELSLEMEANRGSIFCALDAESLELLARAKEALYSFSLKPPLYGRGSNPNNVDSVREGTIQGMLVENNYNSGYLAVAQMADKVS